jgi:hypothetical protein
MQRLTEADSSSQSDPQRPQIARKSPDRMERESKDYHRRSTSRGGEGEKERGGFARNKILNETLTTLAPSSHKITTTRSDYHHHSIDIRPPSTGSHQGGGGDRDRGGSESPPNVGVDLAHVHTGSGDSDVEDVVDRKLSLSLQKIPGLSSSASSPGSPTQTLHQRANSGGGEGMVGAPGGIAMGRERSGSIPEENDQDLSGRGMVGIPHQVTLDDSNNQGQEVLLASNISSDKEV